MLYRFLRKRISEFKLKEDNTMRINGFSGTNTQTGTMGMTQGNDSVSKNIQNQIANAQQKLQDLSSNEEMSLEDKMKKRQEIQQEINNLNQQLRQHQIEQRKEQQSKIRHLWMIWWLEQVTLLKRKTPDCHRQVCRR